MAESDKESPKGSLSVKWKSEDKATWLRVDSCHGAALEVLEVRPALRSVLLESCIRALERN